MNDRIAASSSERDLLALLRRVRRRWRLRVALRGLAIVLGVALVVFLVSALALERLRFTPEAIRIIRIAAYAIVAVCAVWLLGRPLARRPSNAEIALYLEERDPSLEAALLSAVEELDGGMTPAERSPALSRRLIETALQRARTIEDAHPIEQRSNRRSAAVLAGALGAAVLLFAVGPAFLRHAARILVVPWSAAAAATPYLIDVSPGHVTIARGGDQQIAARLRGFTAERVELAVQRAGSGDWEHFEMGSTDSGHVYRLFDLDAPTDYVVTANGVRSPVYRIGVADLPSVTRLDLEYRYPGYTGLAVETVEDGGDIAAPRGTQVRVRVTPSAPIAAGRLVVDGGSPVPLVADSADSAGALVGTLTVERDGFYRIQLQTTGGEMVTASLDYAIEVLPDRAPSVRIAEPGRDARVTAIEEVFARVEAEDDYGVARVELVYAVNGGAERTVGLQRAGRRPVREVSAGHTFFLEEFGLEPGDLVAYYARAADGDAVSGAKTAATDIYFMRIRPFGQEYREAEQSGAPGQAGESPEGLSARQREIIAATFKTVRDRAATSERERRENLATLTLAQGRVRQQVEAVVARLGRAAGAGVMDSALAQVAAELPKAMDAMREAEDRLGRREPDTALPPEQRALQHLQRAEAAFREVTVSRGEPQSGGGGGEQPDAEELADLFELETDRLQNQYETVQRGGAEDSTAQQVDEVLERLRQLASRQQKENERLRQQADRLRAQGAQGGSDGGSGQRELADETEEMARQLERLARERSSASLQQSARRLQQAADEMRRSAARGGEQGTARGRAALERLEEARRQLDAGRTDGAEAETRQALERARRLADEQRRLAESPESGARREAERDSLADRVEGLESDLDRLARDVRGASAEGSRRIREAAEAIRDGRLPDKLRFANELARGASPESVRGFEEQIGEGMGEVVERLEQAAEAVRAPAERQAERALERTRELVRGLESLDERMRQGSSSAAGRPGQGGANVGGRGAEDDRQFGRELRERRGDAEELRRELAGQGLDPRELDRLIAEMRALEGRRVSSDAETLARLRAAVIEGLKAFEFALARRLDAEGGDRPLLGPGDEVPPGFREMVERYYESLAR